MLERLLVEAHKHLSEDIKYFALFPRLQGEREGRIYYRIWDRAEEIIEEFSKRSSYI
jgi:hypothetical protein